MDMMNVINQTNISSFAYTNEEICQKPIRGIVLEFHGLGGGAGGMTIEHPSAGVMFAGSGMLYVLPYYGPWSWMNDTAVKTVDAIVAALFDKYSFADDTPIISTGYSMGGLSALIYTRYAARTPAACAANCPVCDLPYHYTERADLPRTIYHAFAHYKMDFFDAVKTASPVHQAENMPDIPYFIAHCTADKSVNKEKHSDVFVKAMRSTNHNVTYLPVPDRGHCDLSDEAKEQWNEFVLSFAK